MESFSTMVPSSATLRQDNDDLTDDIEDKNASYFDYSQSKVQSTQSTSNSSNSDGSNNKKKKKKSVFTQLLSRFTKIVSKGKLIGNGGDQAK
jgi:hypothetical protein